MRSRDLALTLLISAASGLPAQSANAPQETPTREQKIWTNADLEQLVSRGFTPKVPTQRVWSNVDLNRLRDEEVISKAPPEKVWTNERLQHHLSQLAVSEKPGEKLWTKADLDRLKDQSLISIIGAVEGESVPLGQESPYDEISDPQWYTAQAAALHAELDHRQAELKGFLLGLQRARNNENMANGVSLSETVIGITPESAIQFLQRRVQDTQNQLDDLEDLARRNGIEPGVLRVLGLPAR